MPKTNDAAAEPTEKADDLLDELEICIKDFYNRAITRQDLDQVAARYVIALNHPLLQKWAAEKQPASVGGRCAPSEHVQPSAVRSEEFLRVLREGKAATFNSLEAKYLSTHQKPRKGEEK